MSAKRVGQGLVLAVYGSILGFVVATSSRSWPVAILETVVASAVLAGVATMIAAPWDDWEREDNPHLHHRVGATVSIFTLAVGVVAYALFG